MKAFVIRLWTAADKADSCVTDDLTGTVEPIGAGQPAPFRSDRELLRMLREKVPAGAAPWRVVALAAALALLVVAGAEARPLLTVSITSAPSDPTTSTDATFVFSSDARDATFTCSLDEARATPCRSPVTYTGLALGRHKVAVTAQRRPEQARTTHTWTIVPAPPPPATAWLTVMVEGAGTVVSAPGGIACPGDCAEAFTPGTVVALAAKPSAGSELEDWSGACAGKGACAVTVRESSFVKASFAPAVTPPDRRRGDPDGDGVPNMRDDCPETAGPGKPLMRGCSLLDLFKNGGALLGRLDEYDYPGRYADRFDGIDRLTPVYRQLLRDLTVIRTGAAKVEHGDVCGGAAAMRRGARAMQKTVARSARLVAGVQAAIAREPAGAADADDKDIRWAGWHYRQGLLKGAGEEASRLRMAYDAACRKMGAQAIHTGRVKNIDDARRLLRLENRRFALPQGSYGKGLAEGARARIVARAVEGGPALVESAVALGVVPKPNPPTVGGLPCVSLLFAPPQDWTKPNPILHPTLGYVANDVYRLEEGVRFAATPECPAGQSARYSLRVVFTAQGELTKTIADLTSDDGPVPVPIAGGSKTWTITATERKQEGGCTQGDQPNPYTVQDAGSRIPASAAKSYPCPPVDIRTTTYHAKVRPPGWYATALYDEDVLAVNETGLDTTDVFVVGINDSSAFGAGFEAEGYGTTGTDPPFAFKTVHKGEPFGVRPDNWYSIYWYSNQPAFLLYHMGVDHFAGLVWPRIVGTRHGSPFRYRVTLPAIVKDLLPSCGGGENCFFRLPWAAGNSEKTTQGNNQPASHNGNQAYAFDFVHEDGETIYATRGGVVGDVVESLTMNCPPPADCPSNYVRIDHQDGTYSWYAHVKTNSVIPGMGQRVLRGQAIALVGNVGRSTSSHLHYQASIDATNTIYGQTIPICFEAIWFDVDTGDPVIDPCYVPVTGYFTQSTNG